MNRDRFLETAAAVGVRQQRYRWLLFLGAAALLFVVGLACGGSSGGGAAPASDGGGTASTSRPTASAASDLAPGFSFTLFQGGPELGGDTVNIGDLRGKPVILNFWAGLCPPCRAEMPDLQAYYDDNKEEVSLVGVDVGQFMGLGSKRDAENLLKELNITYPAGFANDLGVIRDYKVLGMPTTVFINPDGSIFDRWTGALSRDILGQKIAIMNLDRPR